MQTTNDIIQDLKAERKALGYSQVELADLLGVTSRTVSSYERGEYVPAIPKLREWCEALNLKLCVALKESTVPEVPAIPCSWCGADMIAIEGQPDYLKFCSEGCSYSAY